ncbi:MAG: bis(5'-nucleosyl)-tetraphosphatase (symmetrical) YqeK [Tractidigestivibacter sp.]|jgi:predicted HD superfamily hydrolase involved in NAD metabolism|uniref:bis(5'-nucleosyl)-tetraphosphatase (symmetrical) YqeK n=1 Tax=Tractidigestivibacter sp. TaxID=2847320 RepID=UPI003D9215C8
MAGKNKPNYTDEQLCTIAGIEADVKEHLAAKPHRLGHSLSVAQCAEKLALAYGVDPYLAHVAGLLHDWDKALSKEQVIERARELGIDLGVDLRLVQPLLHGIVAARELPSRYPDLPPEVWHAISVHTTAAPEMSPLDEVLFVADGIEPMRPDTPGIHSVRKKVGEVSLDDLFWESFVGGIVYVLDGSRYLWPGTIDTYNKIAQRRSHQGE